MPKLTIDQREITVPQGTKVIDAAERLGIVIPRFCYHPALGAVGACRVCAVNCLDGPLKGIQMSCMIDAQEGMVISTTDDESVDFRKHVIEWLMLHHPHDCPVCDEGGHCLLQDLTVSGGHGIRRYRGPKRTYTDQYLGPLVHHEMNRCIQCYRCVRFYQEFTGYDDLGVMQIGNRVYYGRFQPGTLESPFAGNLIDICPTGVYTDKPSRYRGRRWDFERSPMVCLHCSLGCRMTVSTRYREVIRQEARYSDAINGHFICDRGRYGFAYVNRPERPRTARVDRAETGWHEALKAAGERLEAASWKTGPEGIAVACSGRSSLETQGMARRLAAARGWTGPVHAIDPATAANVRRAVKRLEPDLTISLREIENADCVVVVAADPVNEAPMLAPALRQARRKGARVAVIDPRPVDLPFGFDHFPVPSDDLSGALGLLIRSCADREPLSELGKRAVGSLSGLPERDDIPGSDRIADLYDDLHGSRRPVVVCGTQTAPPEVPGMAADLARLLRVAGPEAGLFYLLPEANSFGAALLSDPSRSVEEILGAIERSEIRALVAVETDLFRSAETERVRKALERLDLLVTFDYIDSPTARAADILIPTLTAYETRDLFINSEGRAQRTPGAFRGGEPISQTGGGDHPPRTFRQDIPGREMGAAWSALLTIGGKTPDRQPLDLTAWLAEAHPALARLPGIADFPPEGIRLNLTESPRERFQGGPARPLDEDDEDEAYLTLLIVDSTFGTEELSHLSPALRERETPPSLYLHPADAGELALSAGDTVRIATEAGTLDLPVRTSDAMARGTMVIPRHRDIEDRLPRENRIRLTGDAILKITEAA
jgi:NADH-quinone oxidoreductase subunit G